MFAATAGAPGVGPSAMASVNPALEIEISQLTESQ